MLQNEIIDISKTVYAIILNSKQTFIKYVCCCTFSKDIFIHNLRK